MLIKQHTLLDIHSEYDPDPFNNFPVGLLILEKDPTATNGKYFINYSNNVANNLLSVPCNKDIELFKKKLRYFTKLTRLNHFNYELTEMNLCDQIFSNPNNCEVINEKFVSLNFMIYVKIRFLENQILISVDNYNDERKSIQSNIVKNLGYKYLLTLYHEINNPLNSLLGSIEEVASPDTKNEKTEKFTDRIKLLIRLIKIFIKNFILSFKIAFEEMKRTNINLEFIFNKVSTSFESIFNYKKIIHEEDYHILSNKVIVSDYFYFKSLLKNIFIYLYHKIERDGGFGLEINIKNCNQAKISFVKQSSTYVKSLRYHHSKETTELDKSFLEELDIKNSIQTIEITKDIIMKLSNLLGTKAKVYNDSTRCYLSLTLDYRTEEVLEDDDSLSECSPTTKKRNLSAITRSISILSGNTLINQMSTTLSSTLRNSVKMCKSGPLETVIPSRNYSFSRTQIERPMYMKRSSEQITTDVRNFNLRKMVSWKAPPKKAKNSFALGIKDIPCTATSSSPRNKSKKRIKSRLSKRGVMSRLYKRISGDKLSLPRIMCDINSDVSDKTNPSRGADKYTPISFGRTFSFQFEGSGTSNRHNPSPDYSSFNKREREKRKQENLSKEVSLDQCPEDVAIDKGLPTPIRTSTQLGDNHLNPPEELVRLGSFSQFMFNIPNEQQPVVGSDDSPKILRFPTISADNPLNLHREPVPFLVSMKRRSTSITPVDAKRLRTELCECNDVLLVDDEIFNLNSLQMLLKKNNVRADTCLNGKLGLERIIEKKEKVCPECKCTSYRLIFMDIMMPEMDGLEVSNRLQELVNKGELSDEMKIIIISSQENEHIQSIIAKIPLIAEFVTKPVKRMKIEEILRNFYYS